MMFNRLKKAMGLSVVQRRSSRAGSVLAEQISQITGAATTPSVSVAKKKGFRFKEEEAIYPNFEDLPKPQLPFDVEKIEKRIENIVETKVNYVDEDTETKWWTPYDPQKCNKLSQDLAKEIKEDIKSMELQRYRIVVVVTIIQKQLQGIDYKMKYCLDPQHDSFAKYTYENSHFYIIVTVLLAYKD